MESSKYKAVKGKLPTKVDLAGWKPEQFIVFLQFVSYFIKKTEKSSTLSVTNERWKGTEEFMLMPDHPFQEHLYRIDRFYFDEKASAKMFYFRLLNYIRITLGYIHANPSVVTDSMREFIEREEKFVWCLHHTKVVNTNAGVEVVVPDQGPAPLAPNTPASIQSNLYESMFKVTNLMTRLANSITQKDINAMSPKDRIMAIGRLSFVYNVAKGGGGGPKVLQQINIHSASREDMEAALLAFNKEQ